MSPVLTSDWQTALGSQSASVLEQSACPATRLATASIDVQGRESQVSQDPLQLFRLLPGLAERGLEVGEWILEDSCQGMETTAATSNFTRDLVSS